MPSEPPAVPPPGASWPPPPALEAEAAPTARFATPRRLHPASVIVGVNLRYLLQAFLLPVAATIPAGGRVTLIVVALVATIGLVLRILAWQRFDYSFDGEVLRVNEGVIRRSHRALDVARIQQVEVDRPLLQRLLGFASLRVETAGSSSEVEVELRVVTSEEADALRAAVRAGKAQAVRHAGADAPASDAGEPERHVLLRVPLAHVMIAAMTGARLLVFPAVVGGAFQLASQYVEIRVERAIRQLVEAGIVGPNGFNGIPTSVGLLVAVGVLVLSVASAVVVGVLGDARFRIVRVEDDLHVSRGLLSTRSSVLPLQRIQTVQVHRNWLRRLLGFASVRIHSAGGSGGGDRRVTVPLLPGRDVDGLIRDVYPGVIGIPELAPHPRNAGRRAVFRWVRAAAYPVAAVWLLPFDWLEPFEWPVLVLPPFAALLGYVEYRQLAHATDDRVLAARQGALSVTTSVTPLAKIQGVTTRSNWFQRRLRLATVRAHVAGPGGDVEVLDTGDEQARALHDRLTVDAADPAPVGPRAAGHPVS